MNTTISIHHDPEGRLHAHVVTEAYVTESLLEEVSTRLMTEYAERVLVRSLSGVRLVTKLTAEGGELEYFYSEEP